MLIIEKDVKQVIRMIKMMEQLAFDHFVVQACVYNIHFIYMNEKNEDIANEKENRKKDVKA